MNVERMRLSCRLLNSTIDWSISKSCVLTGRISAGSQIKLLPSSFHVRLFHLRYRDLNPEFSASMALIFTTVLVLFHCGPSPFTFGFFAISQVLYVPSSICQWGGGALFLLSFFCFSTLLTLASISAQSVALQAYESESSGLGRSITRCIR